MGQADFGVDFIQPSGYTVYGEFFEGVHQHLTIRAQVAACARIIPSVF
jgi:hypothetical protein